MGRAWIGEPARAGALHAVAYAELVRSPPARRAQEAAETSAGEHLGHLERSLPPEVGRKLKGKRELSRWDLGPGNLALRGGRSLGDAMAPLLPLGVAASASCAPLLARQRLEPEVVAAEDCMVVRPLGGEGRRAFRRGPPDRGLIGSAEAIELTNLLSQQHARPRGIDRKRVASSPPRRLRRGMGSRQPEQESSVTPRVGERAGGRGSTVT